jgi:hypothetical protein
MKIKDYLEEVEKERKVIVRPANSEHSEITVCISTYTLKVPEETMYDKKLLGKILKKYAKNPVIDVKIACFNTLLITCTSKTERRGDDIFDAEKGIKIAVAKNNIKVCKVASDILITIFNDFINRCENLTYKVEKIKNCYLREIKYLDKV